MGERIRKGVAYIRIGKLDSFNRYTVRRDGEVVVETDDPGPALLAFLSELLELEGAVSIETALLELTIDSEEGWR